MSRRFLRMFEKVQSNPNKIRSNKQNSSTKFDSIQIPNKSNRKTVQLNTTSQKKKVTNHWNSSYYRTKYLKHHTKPTLNKKKTQNKAWLYWFSWGSSISLPSIFAQTKYYNYSFNDILCSHKQPTTTTSN